MISKSLDGRGSLQFGEKSGRFTLFFLSFGSVWNYREMMSNEMKILKLDRVQHTVIEILSRWIILQKINKPSFLITIYASVAFLFFSFFFFRKDGVRRPFFFFLSFFGESSEISLDVEACNRQLISIDFNSEIKQWNQLSY